MTVFKQIFPNTGLPLVCKQIATPPNTPLVDSMCQAVWNAQINRIMFRTCHNVIISRRKKLSLNLYQ